MQRACVCSFNVCPCQCSASVKSSSEITLKVLIIVFCVCVCVLSIIRPTYSSQINFRFTATVAAPTVEDYLAVYVHFASYVKYFT